jgi:hypothetical protein
MLTLIKRFNGGRLEHFLDGPSNHDLALDLRDACGLDGAMPPVSPLAAFGTSGNDSNLSRPP